MRAERIESGLQPRLWSFNRPGQAPSRHLLLLTDGAGEAESGEARHALAAPALLWLGRPMQSRLRIDAGAAGHRAWTEEDMIAAAVGDQADSASLAALAERDFVLSLAGSPEETAAIGRCLGAVASERTERRAGSDMMLSALLRIVLVLIQRVAGGAGPHPPSSGERRALLQRFRQLVEMNFRSHWTVAQYADALSVSPDRLHDACRAAVGKPPKALISERLAHEAATRLERSTLTIEQLGHLLGFGDPAHFSNFFRRMRGVPPGQYRRLAAAAETEGRRPAARFAD